MSGKREIPQFEWRPAEYTWAWKRLSKPPIRVLDIGCAKGCGRRGVEEFVEFLCTFNYEVVGIDIRPISWKHPNFTFKRESILENSLPTESFDAVVSFQVWQHAGKRYTIGVPKEYVQPENPRGDQIFIEEVYRVLKPKGKSFITTCIVPSIKRSDMREFTVERIMELVDKLKILGIKMLKEKLYTKFLLELEKK